jgi:ribosomal protein S18 acetylase RimI-like enzyme
MQNINYRVPNPNDFDQMFELWWEMQTSHLEYDEIWYKPREKNQSKPICISHWKQLLQNRAGYLLIVESGPLLVGMIIAQMIGRPPPLEHQIKVLEIENVIVKKDFRLMGISKEMMLRIMNQAKNDGAHRVQLCVHSKNDAKFAYEKIGFKMEEMIFSKAL